MFRRLAGLIRIVGGARLDAVLGTDGEAFDAGIPKAGGGDDRARIEAAGQESAERHVETICRRTQASSRSRNSAAQSRAFHARRGR